MNVKADTTLFGGLITSKTRVQILMRLFLNPLRKAYLRELANEFNTSPSLVKQELNALEASGWLESERSGRQIFFRANDQHPLFPELRSMVHKALGMDRIVDSIITRLGSLQAAWLIDDYAEGKDSGIIDLLLYGEIDAEKLADVVTKTERYIHRKIRTLVIPESQFSDVEILLSKRSHLLLWEAG